MIQKKYREVRTEIAKQMMLNKIDIKGQIQY